MSSPASSTSYLGPLTAIIPPTTSKTTHQFSTTASANATNPGRPQSGVHQRLGKRMKLAKFKAKKEVTPTKKPQSGERKAWRKRIVLSNNNAIPVDGLSVMDEKNLAAPSSSGEVLKMPSHAIDQLRASDAFKPSQTWGLFHSPHTLVRPETVRVCKRMLDAAAQKETARLILSGDKASGKSTLLIQAMANAYLNDWVVIHIPEGSFLSRQPMFSCSWACQ